MPKVYRIEHISYSCEELALKCGAMLASDLLDWERDAWTFIVDWFDDSTTVKLQTSGSTGAPKLIQVSKALMRNSARMTLDFLELKEGDSALLCLSANYIAGKMMIVRALEGGLDLLIREAVGNPLEAIEITVDFAAMVPLQIEKILNEDGLEKLRSIKQVIIGGAVVSPALAERLRPLSNAIWATYGMTETVSHVALKRLSGSDLNDRFVPMPGVHFSLDDRACLQIDAPHLADDNVVTNDMVSLSDDQSFTFLGRYDNVINSGGYKISPEEVEGKIAHLINDRFIVSSVADDRLGNKVVLVVETQSPKTYNWAILKEQINAALPVYACPRAIYFVEKFQETPTAKIKRQIDLGKA